MNKFTGEFEKESFDLEEINRKASSNLEYLIEQEEANFHTQILNIVKDIKNKQEHVNLVLLTGPSSAGKTTSSNLLCQYLQNEGYKTIVVSQDNFFVDASNTPRLPDGSFDYENVSCIDIEAFDLFLHELQNNKIAHMPKFDFIKKRRSPVYQEIHLDENSIIIMEGIHALNPILTKNISSKSIVKIYIGLNSNYFINGNEVISAKTVRLMRRCLRDFYTRGHSVSATIEMWKNVCNGENIYIKPFKNSANYLLNSSHSYEILLYAKYLKPLLESSFALQIGREMISMLEKCTQISSELIPENSLIQEFLAGN